MDIQKERKDFEAVTNTYHCIYNADLNYYFSGSKFAGDKAEIEVNAGWKAWQAKAQAVPERLAIKDVINERQRQVNQEFYSIENDDEYKENELVRAAACYTNNVVSRGWTYSESDLETYQSEEAPDFWPWDLDFWKPKSPRKDLVRAAALLIAEIERIDRAQEQKG